MLYKDFVQALLELVFTECTKIKTARAGTIEYMVSAKEVPRNKQVQLHINGMKVPIDIHYTHRQYRILHKGWNMFMLYDTSKQSYPEYFTVSVDGRVMDYNHPDIDLIPSTLQQYSTEFCTECSVVEFEMLTQFCTDVAETSAVLHNCFKRKEFELYRGWYIHFSTARMHIMHNLIQKRRA